jgi:hypothetical protein
MVRSIDMTQPQLQKPYSIVTVFCTHCQEEQLLHVESGTGFLAMAHQWIQCLKCGRQFDVMVPDTIIAGPFLP